MKYFIGIDPGTSGAIAIISEDLEFVGAWLFEDLEKASSIVKLIKEIIGEEQRYAAIEKIHSFPGQSLSSMDVLMTNYGYWQGIIDSQSIPLCFVSPKKWQIDFITKTANKVPIIKSSTKIKDMSRKEKKEYDKKKRQRRIVLKGIINEYVATRFPQVDLKRKKDQDKADAICIALWARKEFR